MTDTLIRTVDTTILHQDSAKRPEGIDKPIVAGAELDEKDPFAALMLEFNKKHPTFHGKDAPATSSNTAHPADDANIPAMEEELLPAETDKPQQDFVAPKLADIVGPSRFDVAPPVKPELHPEVPVEELKVAPPIKSDPQAPTPPRSIMQRFGWVAAGIVTVVALGAVGGYAGMYWATPATDAELRQQVADAETAKNLAETRLGEVTAERDDAIETRDTVIGTSESLSADLSKAETTIGQLTTEASALNTQITGLNGQIATLVSQGQEDEAVIAALKAESTALTARLEDVQARLTRQGELAESIQAADRGTIAALKAEIATLNGDVVRLTAALEDSDATSAFYLQHAGMYGAALARYGLSAGADAYADTLFVPALLPSAEDLIVFTAPEPLVTAEQTAAIPPLEALSLPENLTLVVPTKPVRVASAAMVKPRVAAAGDEPGRTACLDAFFLRGERLTGCESHLTKVAATPAVPKPVVAVKPAPTRTGCPGTCPAKTRFVVDYEDGRATETFVVTRY